MSNILLTQLNLATMTSHGSPHIPYTPYGFIEDGAVVIEGDRIAWCGQRSELPQHYLHYEHHQLDGRLVTPALIDCHTHLVFGGSRANEFEMRLKGLDYPSIAQAGGGILSTVNATNNSSDEELLTSALERIDCLLAEGVSTVEIKSGYSLTIEGELRLLRIARAIGQHRPITIHTTFLGAHSLPLSYKEHPEDYIQDICIPALEQAHQEGLVDAVDAFCEGIAFTTTQLTPLFQLAQELNIPVKLHAEQLSNIGGSVMACQYQALSCDHLEYSNHDAIKAMAQSGSCAVLLPGAFYYLQETQKPPVDLLRKHRVPIAVATDCNPGTSPLHSILSAANMACVLFQLTPEEALAGITREAAKALGLSDTGCIETGYCADLAIWNVSQPAELIYPTGITPLFQRIFRGQLCKQ